MGNALRRQLGVLALPIVVAVALAAGPVGGVRIATAHSYDPNAIAVGNVSAEASLHTAEQVAWAEVVPSRTPGTATTTSRSWRAPPRLSAADVAVIGKVDDLAGYTLRPGERTLLNQLPNQGSPRLSYLQNDRVLRTEMGRGVPIRDVSVDPVTGALRNNTGFLRASAIS